ncbi:antibiotic biosynthesis monooxygenase [Chryseomicrobium sp. FSL W7-1435]|uniref:antibiotic biosynthesis monooxygenase family protein n=1 Tax=Chryseomicrobium sp. FSL W7-1435 TaxID=2921704 RepID=UPI00315AD354
MTYFYTTSGTPEFMKQLQGKYSAEPMHLLYGASRTLLVHETTGKTKFQTPRSYEVLETFGEFQQQGHFYFYHIPVTDEGRPVFEHATQQIIQAVSNEPGLFALRVLRPVKADTYLIVSQWSGPSSYKQWADRHLTPLDTLASKQNLFTSAPYTEVYRTKSEEAAD